MLVKDLIEKLKKLDPDKLIVLSSDSEGNSYSPMADMWETAYVPESTWNGYTKLEPDQLTEDMINHGYSEEDVVTGEEGEDWNKAVVFNPTN